MKFVADLHLHSRFSRACSPALNLENLVLWGRKKGIQVLATGDWTHPVWFAEIINKLEQVENGLYKLKKRNAKDEMQDIYFLLSTEISSIYTQAGKQRRIHNLVFIPSLETAEKIIKQLVLLGANLNSDGRPIIGISAKDLAELVLGIESKSLIVPAHVWTPWYSLYGSNSGFNSISECFGEMSKYIYAIETGLSSDPAMNWRVADLDERTILSFSDAHSLEKLGREATVFDGELSYDGIYEAITGQRTKNNEQKTKVAFTIEFYPEEGKYHYTGHRNCGVKHSPDETAKLGTTCPVCGKKLTVGVMHRVDELAKRSVEDLKLTSNEFVKSLAQPQRPPYKMLVPLTQIISQSLQVGEASKEVVQHYNNLVTNFGSELAVLIKTPIEELEAKTAKKIVEGIKKVRHGEIFVDPGFDGVYGKVQIWQEQESVAADISQMVLFDRV